jgi:hypothetical protein
MSHYNTRILIQANRVICGVYMIMALRGREKLLECLPLKLLKLSLRRSALFLRLIRLSIQLSF